MSEENSGDNKANDALSRMIENGQVLGINGDNKPIDFASHKRVVLASDNSYIGSVSEKLIILIKLYKLIMH